MSEPHRGVPGRYVALTLVGAGVILGLFALWYRDLTPLKRPATQPVATQAI